MDNKIPNTKKALFDTWIEDDHILVHFDARRDDVSVPVHLKDQHSLTLKLSLLFQGETKSDNEKISSYLRFNNEYFHCIIPWDAIWGMTSDQGVQKIWETDLPKEVFHKAAQMMIQSMGEKLMSSFKSFAKPDDKNEELLNSPNDETKIDPKEKRKPFLKRIK